MTYEEYLQWKARIAAAEPIFASLARLDDFLHRVEQDAATVAFTIEYVSPDGSRKTIAFSKEEGAIGAGHLLAERLKNDLLTELAQL